MSKKKKNKDRNSSYKIGVIFFAIFLSLLFISLLIKSIIIYKNSRFDGYHRITIAFYESTDIKVISFSPQNRSISLLSINGKIDPKSLSGFLRVPLEGIVYDDSLSIDKTNISSSLIKVLARHKNKNSVLTFFDVVRLIYFARTLPLTSYYENFLSLNSDSSTRDQIASSLFADTGISDEKKRIEVVNASDVAGLGNRLANDLSNLGANVILVSTSEQSEDKSKIIYLGEKSYTVSKLSEILGFVTENKSEDNFADVTIILGKDSAMSDKF